jgi:hypothetical protein
MNKTIILKKSPKIVFLFQGNGFHLIDEESTENSGFYNYNDLQSIKLNKVWFPRLAKWLRRITWIMNGVPFFPTAAEYKKASIVIQFKQSKVGLWLTDTYMADNAKLLKKILENRSTHLLDSNS